MPEPLDKDMVRDSAKCGKPTTRQRMLAARLSMEVVSDGRLRTLSALSRPERVRRWYADNKVFLDESGSWGKMSLDRWNAWLDWLHSNSAPPPHLLPSRPPPLGPLRTAARRCREIIARGMPRTG